jgi:NAD(P)-dependent dehydrogenase (short-subunit alcohol dehydrogenase family)
MAGSDGAGSGGAVVVGGASGIGAALVERYRDAGREVVTWDVHDPTDLKCDVTDEAEIDDALAATIARSTTTPTELTVTAGIGHSGLLTEITRAEWDHVLAVNVTGPWLVMRAWARWYAEHDVEASMVATSSVSARLVDRSMGAYCTSKAALSMTVQIAAAEWAPAIRVNAVAPGVTATPMLGGAPVDRGWLADVADRTSLARLGTADDIAGAILALHSLPWVTGQVLEADGGLALHSPINAWGARPPE